MVLDQWVPLADSAKSPPAACSAARTVRTATVPAIQEVTSFASRLGAAACLLAGHPAVAAGDRERAAVARLGPKDSGREPRAAEC